VAHPLEVAQVEHFRNAVSEFASRDFLQAAAVVQVLGDPHILGQGIIFRHVADEPLDLVRPRRDGQPAD
jgi:hypothetical protein